MSILAKMAPKHKRGVFFIIFGLTKTAPEHKIVHDCAFVYAFTGNNGARTRVVKSLMLALAESALEDAIGAILIVLTGHNGAGTRE